MPYQLEPHQARKEFRTKLLARTLDHAVKHSKFYKDNYARLSMKVRELEDLNLLPVLTKETIIENFDYFTCDDRFPGLIQHTTGTTGKPLPIYRSVEEIEFTRNFYSRTIDFTIQQPMPIILHLVDHYHGPPLEIPSRSHTIPAGVTDDILLAEAIRALTEEHCLSGVERHVSVIVGLVPYIKTLTNYLLESNFDFTQSKVHTVIPLCTIITPRWRQLLSSTWNANVVDRYSLSEIFGGATLCLKCYSYHFDPMVIPEVVDPFTKKVITSGTGVLVLTSLYPFVQKQPMIRYYTNDLVEVSVDSCQPDLSVKFKGRLSNACFVRCNGKPELLVSPVDIYEVLDAYPDVACGTRFLDVRQIKDHSAAGSLKFRVETEGRDGCVLVTLRIGLKYSPHLYPERVTALRTDILDRLIERSMPLQYLIMSNQVRLNVAFDFGDTLLASPLKV